IKEIENYLKQLKAPTPQDERDVNTLLNVLQCPVFGSIVRIQDSLQQLKQEYQKHPSILPLDFDIDTITGQLLLNLPPDVTQASEPDYVNYPTQDKQSTASLNHVCEQQQQQQQQKSGTQFDQGQMNDDLPSYIAKSAKGRDVFIVNLHKSENEN